MQIVRINGTSPTLSEEVVIVGAHQDRYVSCNFLTYLQSTVCAFDSTNLFPFLSAPGADDDGSGTVTILEAYRAILVCGYRPLRSLEFHWSALFPVVVH